MASDLDPDVVAHSLAVLRALYVPESVNDARQRLERERPASNELFDSQVARRLEELRAIDDLVRYLQLAKFPR